MGLRSKIGSRPCQLRTTVLEQHALTLLHSDRTKKTGTYSVWKTAWELHSREGGGPALPAVSNKGCYELQREWSPLQQHPASDQDLSIQTGAAGWHGCRQIQPGAAVCQRTVWRVPGNNHRRWEAAPFWWTCEWESPRKVIWPVLLCAQPPSWLSRCVWTTPQSSLRYGTLLDKSVTTAWLQCTTAVLRLPLLFLTSPSRYGTIARSSFPHSCSALQCQKNNKYQMW